MDQLKITSPAFEPEGWIPDCNSGFGEDFSPEIHIAGMDARAVALAITLDDLDHPIRPGYNHWVAWNIPPVSIVPACLPKGAVIQNPFHMEQGLAYGKHCYRGPKPPFHWNHRYCFTVYVLDTTLHMNTDADKTAVLKSMDGHVLQTGTLYGRYRRKRK